MIAYLVVCLICPPIVIYGLEHAPAGWEDKDGFHYGRK